MYVTYIAECKTKCSAKVTANCLLPHIWTWFVPDFKHIYIILVVSSIWLFQDVEVMSCGNSIVNNPLFPVLLIFLWSMRNLCALNRSHRSGYISKRFPLKYQSTYTNSIPLPHQDEVQSLADYLKKYSRTVVVTGAGVSTSSGIPDYRGPQGSYKRGHKPMVHSDFMGSIRSRQRYWARSMLGWKTFSQASPNKAHTALAQLEQIGFINTIITQNVDRCDNVYILFTEKSTLTLPTLIRHLICHSESLVSLLMIIILTVFFISRLHQKAGSLHVIDLHGRNDRVACQACGCELSRRIFQQQVEAMNPVFASRVAALREDIQSRQCVGFDKLRADGDAEIDIDSTEYDQV